MKRREFSAGLVRGCVVAGAAASGLPWASAQGAAPVAGKDYLVLNPPAPTPANGKIEVVEFFWYGCPHCNAFEPILEPWAKKLPADVDFRRIPVAFREEPFVAHQRIYYALEEMGLLDSMHAKVFAAIHVERQRLDNPTDIAAFMKKNGVDPVKFMSFYNGFSVQTRARQAAQLAQQYKIDGVPALGIAGKYFTSATLAGSPQRALAVTDYLIQRVRAKS